MKRNIIVCGCEQLTTDDYLQFIQKCYKAWEIFPVKDVDLIVEYQSGFKSPMLINTETELLYSMELCGMGNDYICQFAETQLGCINYIVANIRNGNIINLIVK